MWKKDITQMSKIQLRDYAQSLLNSIHKFEFQGNSEKAHQYASRKRDVQAEIIHRFGSTL